jgi:hypothetical protein
MDQESIVYGVIKDAAYVDDMAQRRNTNRQAMLALPSADDWPLVSREMFGIPEGRNSTTAYLTEVMHFGASYQAVEHEWEQWIATFESLLRNMYWVSATVHLETELNGVHTFTWNTNADCHRPGSADMRIHCEWSHESAVGF